MTYSLDQIEMTIRLNNFKMNDVCMEELKMIVEGVEAGCDAGVLQVGKDVFMVWDGGLSIEFLTIAELDELIEQEV